MDFRVELGATTGPAGFWRPRASEFFAVSDGIADALVAMIGPDILPCASICPGVAQPARTNTELVKQTTERTVRHSQHLLRRSLDLRQNKNKALGR
jgi:hypothetical protein